MFFPEIYKAIRKAKTINLGMGRDKYEFHEYGFGENGTCIPYELISEIVSGLSDSINRTNDDFDFIIAPVTVWSSNAVVLSWLRGEILHKALTLRKMKSLISFIID